MICLLLVGVALAQDTTEPATTAAGAAKPAEGEDAKPAAQGVNADARAAGDGEDCEEAWEYLEFLKTNVK